MNWGCYQLGFHPFDTTKTKIENRSPMPTDEDDQDGHLNHPERGAYSAA